MFNTNANQFIFAKKKLLYAMYYATIIENNDGTVIFLNLDVKNSSRIQIRNDSQIFFLYSQKYLTVMISTLMIVIIVDRNILKKKKKNIIKRL